MISSVRKYFWIFNAAAWTVLALFMSRQLYEVYSQSSTPVSWLTAFAMEMSYCLQWILLAPFVLWLAVRFRFDRRSWLLSGIIHILTGMALSSLTMIIRTLLSWMIIKHMQTEISWSKVLESAFTAYDYGIMSYLLLLLISYVFEYYERFREREFTASRLESQLANAQLQALKMQLHPHFLFNTLNAIAVLIRKNENTAALNMLTGLSELLRVTLNGAQTQEIPLKKELDILELYLKIQQVRFHDRLQVSMNIHPETVEAQVPNLFLQPLVENAIQHGIAPLARPGHVSVHAERNNGWLSIEIRDDGVGINASQEELLTKGIGLSNTLARLEKMYGNNYRFDLSGHPEGGAVVSLKIPFHTAPRS